MNTKTFGKGAYAEALKDPRWQKKRLEIFERDGWGCRNCGEKESTLVVHHRKYIIGHKPWEYDDSYLQTLCEGCHSNIHQMKDDIRKAIDEEDFCTLDALHNLLIGLKKYDSRFDGSDVNKMIFMVTKDWRSFDSLFYEMYRENDQNA